MKGIAPAWQKASRSASVHDQRRNAADIPAIFDLIEAEGIRAYLVYTGRGSKLIEEDLDHAESRAVLDLIMDRTRQLSIRAWKRFSRSTTTPTGPMSTCGFSRKSGAGRQSGTA